MIDPSTGNFTFLYTDIEGSTQLWERYPVAMKAALARHDAILRLAIETHHGSVFKIIGDAFCAVFTVAPEALAAALTAQRALHAETWGETPIKVRMALHSGAAETRDGDYFGPMFNRLARLLSAGHGGQTLLSAATYELVRASLPPDAELRDMGERRLKDLIQPEHIYQLLIPDLPAQFPPLKTLDNFRTNLPAQLTSFIGREKEIAVVKQLMKANRLTTLIGSGGAGKTRLSLQVAAQLLDFFLDGVWFVKFAPLVDPALVNQTVLNTIGLINETDRPSLDIVTNYLGAKKVLLILDNCEHVIETAAQLAEALLQSCPNLCLLVSGREALNIPGEAVYRVPSLSIPDLRKLSSVDMLMQYEATRLFIERAQTALHTFTVMNTNMFSVAQICSRLDGIPLAIELAAARVRLLEVEQIAKGLDDRFHLLTGGSRTALPRQQTLRALIDWSYDLLSEPERALLRRLSVFAGGWTLEAAEEICKDEVTRMKDEENLPASSFILHPFDVLDLLTQLVNKSLILVDAQDIAPVGYAAETRYRMLETIRQYAREKLSDAAEGPQVCDQHLEYFLALAERAELELTGARVAEWLQRLEVEVDNLRAALEWSLKHNVQVGLRLASALLWFWEQGGYTPDGRKWLEQLLDHAEAQSRTLIRAKALRVWSHLSIRGGWVSEPEKIRPKLEESIALSWEIGDRQEIASSQLLLALLASNTDRDYERGWQLATQSLGLYRELDEKLGIAWALTTLGGCLGPKEQNAVHTYLPEALAIFREFQNLPGIVHVLMHLGEQALGRGDYEAAYSYLEEGLEIQRRLGKGGYAMRILGALGDLTLWKGDYVKAQLFAEESLAMTEQLGGYDQWPWVRLAYINLRQGNTIQARRLFEESLQHFKENRNAIGVIYTLEGFASLALLQGQLGRAAQIFAWADLKREPLSMSRPVIEQASVDRDLAVIRAQLDEAALALAQAAGSAMSMDQAVEYALQANHPSTPALPGTARQGRCAAGASLRLRQSHRPDVPSGGQDE